MLLAVEAAIREHRDRLVALERAETGKPLALAEGDLDGTADYFGFYAAAARTLGGETIDVGGGTHMFTRREPYGVVALVTPWNYAANQARPRRRAGARGGQCGRDQAVGVHLHHDARDGAARLRGRSPRRVC